MASSGTFSSVTFPHWATVYDGHLRDILISHKYLPQSCIDKMMMSLMIIKFLWGIERMSTIKQNIEEKE
jgi:hypothetical protein